MAARRGKKVSHAECKKHKGKALIIVGFLAIAYGAMRNYGLTIPQSIMGIGVLLVLKGIILKMKK